MSYILRTFDCEVCGKETTRRRHPGDPRRCVDCGMDISAQTNRQLAENRGPAYERWLAGMKRAYTDRD